MEIKRETNWATYVYYIDNPEAEEMKGDLLDLCYSLKAAGSSSDVSPEAKHRLFESAFEEKQFLDHPPAAPLQEFFTRAVEGALAHEVDIYESWCHITNDHGYHDIHEHSECHWAGIYYLQSGECSFKSRNGVNCFYTPLDSASKHLHPDIKIPEALEGRLVVFPNYLKHSALPYSGEQDRVIISFNSRYAKVKQIW